MCGGGIEGRISGDLWFPASFGFRQMLRHLFLFRRMLRHVWGCLSFHRHTNAGSGASGIEAAAVQVPACLGAASVAFRHPSDSGRCSGICGGGILWFPASVAFRQMLRHLFLFRRYLRHVWGAASVAFRHLLLSGILRIPADAPASVGAASVAFRHPSDSGRCSGICGGGILWGGRGGDVADRNILWYADSMPSEELSAKLAAVEAKLDLLIVSIGTQAANVAELRDRIGDLERHRSFLLGAFAAGSAVGGLIMTLFDRL